VKLLLDTHAFLWFVSGAQEMEKAAGGAIESEEAEASLSVASIWEIAIKASLGKLELDVPLVDLIETGVVDNGIAILPVQVRMGS
jgi:PIN domain nuclease of toxin-antitoxin system